MQDAGVLAVGTLISGGGGSGTSIYTGPGNPAGRLDWVESGTGRGRAATPAGVAPDSRRWTRPPIDCTSVASMRVAGRVSWPPSPVMVDALVVAAVAFPTAMDAWWNAPGTRQAVSGPEPRAGDT